MTIHEITKTDLIKLDNLTHKYLKKWAGVPRCATNSIFHLQMALNIPSISQIYTESHVMTYVDAKMKADSTVNHVLDQKLNRERNMTRKSSIIFEVAKTLGEITAENPNLFTQKGIEFEDANNNPPIQYCICQGEDDGTLMIGCDYCEEWYHPRCLNFSDEKVRELAEQQWRCPKLSLIHI